jgi:hypothetical protein
MDHWANIRRVPAGPDPGPLPLADSLESVAALYRRIPSGRLVVLGRAGAGKTVLAVRLLNDLIRGRERADPVPVIVEVRLWDPAAGRWIVLTCGWLPLTGRLPWVPAAFLEEARRRGVLRQAGAYYQFRHARLQDHLVRTATAERSRIR